MLLKKQATGDGKNYNVMKNVSTHSMLNDPDGERVGLWFVYECVRVCESV